jgi:hypothetical protein
MARCSWDPRASRRRARIAKQRLEHGEPLVPATDPVRAAAIAIASFVLILAP